jgi:hypothetical protein
MLLKKGNPNFPGFATVDRWFTVHPSDREEQAVQTVSAVRARTVSIA